MTPADVEILLAFLYGPAWSGRFAEDARMRADNLRRLVTGRREIPPAVAEFLLRRTADRWLLRGWAEERPPPGLSPPIAAELERRVEDARQAMPGPQPSEPRGTGHE
jgi:hypothetical protein